MAEQKKDNTVLKIRELDPELFDQLCKRRKLLFRAAFDFTNIHQSFLNGKIRAGSIDEYADRLLSEAQKYSKVKAICNEMVDSHRKISESNEREDEPEVEVVEAEPKVIEETPTTIKPTERN